MKRKKRVVFMTDAFTKCIEVFVIKNKEAQTLAEALFNQWICRHGTPVSSCQTKEKYFCN
jgi:hypothetical protein